MYNLVQSVKINMHRFKVGGAYDSLCSVDLKASGDIVPAPANSVNWLVKRPGVEERSITGHYFFCDWGTVPKTTLSSGSVMPAPMEAKDPRAYAAKSHLLAYLKTL